MDMSLELNDLRRRTRDGLVGFCRAGTGSGRYVLVFLENPDSPADEQMWALEFSHPTPGQYGAVQYTGPNNAWDRLTEDFLEWQVDWAPEAVNDRAFFRIFGVEAPMSDAWRSRFERFDTSEALLPVIVDTGVVRRSRVSKVLGQLIQGALSTDPDFGIREGFGRFKRKEIAKILDGSDYTLDRVNGLLWDVGYTLAVVPIGSTLRAGPLMDPWEEFLD